MSWECSLQTAHPVVSTGPQDGSEFQCSSQVASHGNPSPILGPDFGSDGVATNLGAACDFSVCFKAVSQSVLGM